MNRLIREKSPYLLQHAENPVDWFPWGQEALLKAQEESKPIFLSIGYSACHWCHVMEEESFSDPAIAEILNAHFVPVKVDREERPDLDQVYMRSVTAMTGSGGWPLNVFLTPAGIPFYGGTYFPPSDRWGAPAFARVLQVIAEKWKSGRLALQDSGQALVAALRSQSEKSSVPQTGDAGLLLQAFRQYRAQFDAESGGFGAAPKFPPTHALQFLLRFWKKQGVPEALEMAEQTLQKMARGGIRDFLGGGFHRYSTDGAWRVPHFEKMLYDQALIARCYLEAYQATGNEAYSAVAREIFEYVLRDLTDAGGGFYSAEDADSAPDPEAPRKKSEGAFYLWTDPEILGVLGARDANIFDFHFGIEAGGNAPHDPHGEFSKKNILYERASPEETAREFGETPGRIQTLLDSCRARLFKHREKRPRPQRDDKVLTDWNALMISALALGGRVCREPRYLAAAEKAAAFIFSKMRSAEGVFFHRYRSGEAGIPGFLDDYALMLAALLDLFECSGSLVYLAQAKQTAEELLDQFSDAESGGFMFRSRHEEPLFLKVTEIHDSALPSGFAVALQGLLRLGVLTEEPQWTEAAKKAMHSVMPEVTRFPSACAQFLMALSFSEGPILEIGVLESDHEEGAQAMMNEIFSQFVTERSIIFLTREARVRGAAELPRTREWKALEGKSTAWLCHQGVCHAPVTDLEVLKQFLNPPSATQEGPS